MDRSDPVAARFRAAVEGGDADAVRSLVSEHEELSAALDAPWFGFGAPALVEAAGRCDQALVDALLDAGADPDARSEWEAGPYTALHRLVDGPTPESLKLAAHLVARGATVDLHAAAGLGRTDVLAEILDAEPDRVSEPGPDGATPLHLARDATTATFLLDRSAEIEKRCVDHRSTPLMWSVQGSEEVTRLLLERGAKPDLFIAAVLNDVGLAERVLGDEPDAIDVSVAYGRSHPHLGGGDKYVWALGFADTPLEVARRRGHDEVYALLLERSGPVARLVQACRRADVEETRRLLTDDEALLSTLTPEQTCLALQGSPPTVRVLIDAGADPDARPARTGVTALHDACWHGNAELARALLEGGADATVRDALHASTALGWADYAGRTDMVELILEHAEPDVVDAAWLGRVDRVRELLDAHPGLANGLLDEAASPLRAAAYYGHARVVRLLLERGADPTAANPETGMTALDLARQREHAEVVALLEEAAS